MNKRASRLLQCENAKLSRDLHGTHYTRGRWGGWGRLDMIEIDVLRFVLFGPF